MKIIYGKVSFLLDFEKPISWNTLPTFILRSLLGTQLKRICCVQRQLSCEKCNISQSCAYAVLFESPIPKDTKVLPGRNRGAHPFVLTHGKVINSGKQYEFTITLIGFALQFFPFVVLAFQRAGDEGIFSDQIMFSIAQITDSTNGKSLGAPILNPLSTKIFSFDETDCSIANKANIHFITPARIKHRGQYTLDFDAFSLLQSLYRRIEVLAYFYTDDSSDAQGYRPPADIIIAKRNLTWKDFSRYSHRQSAAMELGGALGWIEIQGPIGAREKSLFDAGTIFHVGKNTGFGLGEMSVEWPSISIEEVHDASIE
ncbi:MAG TPA: CRISPR system precrRNA processing endoribonuclease RAMP protein Cas6 [Rectinema sp.]|nr:CRISPR system precrRNA processing endoribonuclease RAMP protein Cas6 [Rectinema sp.]